MVVCNDDAEGGQTGLQSNVAFYAKAGHTYYIQLGGWQGSSGDGWFRMRQVHPLDNDQFGKARVVSTANQLVSGSTRRATWQAGHDPTDCGASPTGATVWFKRKVTTPGLLRVDPAGTYPLLIVAAWSGPDIDHLSSLDCMVAGTP
jgi:hypothetical protein